MPMKNCTNCNRVSKDNFCISCGDRTTELPVCPCGRLFLPSNDFCGDCGKYRDEAIDELVDNQIENE